jgi:hypothetical protein
MVCTGQHLVQPGVNRLDRSVQPDGTAQGRQPARRRSEWQIRARQPAIDRTAVVVTSRRSLAGLDRADCLVLDRLPSADAQRMLAAPCPGPPRERQPQPAGMLPSFSTWTLPQLSGAGLS